MEPRNRKHEFCPKSARVSGLEPWPCPNLMQVRMFSDFRLQPSSERMGFGFSTVERCGSPTVALTKKVRQPTLSGCMQKRVKTSGAVSRCRPSLWKQACRATAWDRKSTTRPVCVRPILRNWCSMIASFQQKTWSAVLANPSFT